MPLIQCNETLKVGVCQFDEEHCRLVDIINQFHAAIKAGDCTVLQITLSKLHNFAREHFSNEEKLLVMHCYPEFEQHRAAHIELIDHLYRIETDVLCSSVTLQYEILQFLLDWLMNHTKDVDKRYGSFLNSKGVY